MIKRGKNFKLYTCSSKRNNKFYLQQINLVTHSIFFKKIYLLILSSEKSLKSLIQ